MTVILNGRAFHDKDIGNFTCQEASVIDYTISSVCALKLFASFKIDDYCPLYSDVHCPILFSLRTKKDSFLNAQIFFISKIRGLVILFYNIVFYVFLKFMVGLLYDIDKN